MSSVIREQGTGFSSGRAAVELGFCFENGGSRGRFGTGGSDLTVVLTGFLWRHSEKKTLG